jgi:hypothetical protein
MEAVAMPVIFAYSAERRRVGDVVRRMASLVAMLCAWASFAVAAPADSRILFTINSAVPRSVQEFAWRVIETRCNYQVYEREQRWFWAYDTRTMRVGAGVVYSINILSEVTWKKSEPPAFIEMTVVDDGRMWLTALKSSFVVCAS